MTADEFDALCNEYSVDPAVALETEAVRYALAWSRKTTNHETAVAIVRNALEGSF